MTLRWNTMLRMAEIYVGQTRAVASPWLHLAWQAAPLLREGTSQKTTAATEGVIKCSTGDSTYMLWDDVPATLSLQAKSVLIPVPTIDEKRKLPNNIIKRNF